MIARLELPQSIYLVNDEPEAAAKSSIFEFIQRNKDLGICPTRQYAFHEATANALFFILTVCRDGGKGNVSPGARSKATKAYNRWHRPVTETVRPVLYLPDNGSPEIWQQLDASHRREYLNDRLSLPKFWAWVDEDPRRAALVQKVADYLGKHWVEAQCWVYVEQLLTEASL